MDILEQNTDAWLKWRKSKIGASDAPIIMGKSPWKTALQLWKEKLSDEIHTFESDAMRRGKELEPIARAQLSKELGIELEPIILTHNDHDFMVASIDGISKDRKTIVEIKCPGHVSHQLAMRGEIAEHYQIQMQHQMAVADLNSITYYSFNGEDGVAINYERDQELIDEIIAQELMFYDCMFNKTSPEAHKLRTDSVWNEYTEQWKEIQQKKKILADEEQECRERLVQLADGGAYGNGIHVSQIERAGAIDYSRIQVLKAIDLDSYRKKGSTYWRITSETSEV